MTAGALLLRRDAGRAAFYLGPTILILAVAVGCPLVFTLGISFTSASFLGTLKDLSFVGFGNYVEIAGSPQFQRAFIVTLKFVAFTVSLGNCRFGPGDVAAARCFALRRQVRGPTEK